MEEKKENINSKKVYEKPKLEIVEMNTKTQLLAHSGFGGGYGRDNACEHGAHKWFCDDFDGED